jgi:hypothetical protein
VSSHDLSRVWPDSDADVTLEQLRHLLRRRNNWGRWGTDDAKGAINLIDEAKRRQAAECVRSGRIVSLSLPLPVTPSSQNPHPAQHFMSRVERGEGGAALDFLGVRAHGLQTTHIDALCHVWDVDGMWNGRRPDDEIGFSGARFGGIEAWADGIVTRGVLFDVPRFRGVPYVTVDEPVHGSELEAIAVGQGVDVGPGDALVVFSGRENYERAEGPWGGVPIDGNPTGLIHERPGLHASCLKYIRDTDASVLVWDMMDLTPNGFGLPWAVHAAIWAFGVALVDNASLKPLAEACHDEGRCEFLLSLAPLHLIGGTGSPVNPVAVL